METDKLKETIYFHNPWWTGKTVPEELLQGFRRPVLETLLGHLGLDRIVVLKGPRRTGKTTLLYQMISALIGRGVSPEDICFLSCEDLEPDGDFDAIIKTYEVLTRRPLRGAKEVFFFLDEVQFLPNWSRQLKKYFDKKYPVRFVVSGSAASLIRKGSESLAGRTVEEVLLPFSFSEYLDYRVRDRGLSDAVGEMRRGFDFFRLPSVDALIPFETRVKILFDEYLQRGGFPHLFKVSTRILWQKLLKEDVIEKVIYRDLIELHQIKKPFVLERLFLYLAAHSSELLNVSNIAASLSLSREYTERYIDYLKGAYLIFKYRRYSKAIETQMRKLEKCYVSDPGLIHLSLSAEPAKLVETAAARHLLARESYYWRDRDYEVDLVIMDRGKAIPVEVKYRNKIAPAELRGVLRYLETYGQDCAVVVTKDVLEERKAGRRRVLCIPAWLFLLAASE